MSLEAALAELTAATKAHTEVLLKVAEGQGKVLAVATEVSAKATTKAADKKAADKPAETPKTETADGPTQADVLGKVAAYAKAAGDDAEKAARKGKIEELLAKVKAKDLKELKPEHYGAFIKAVDVLIDAGNVLSGEEDGGEPDPFG